MKTIENSKTNIENKEYSRLPEGVDAKELANDMIKYSIENESLKNMQEFGYFSAPKNILLFRYIII